MAEHHPLLLIEYNKVLAMVISVLGSKERDATVLWVVTSLYTEFQYPLQSAGRAAALHAAGSARTVNRRYIADFVRKAARTKASAGQFVAVILVLWRCRDAFPCYTFCYLCSCLDHDVMTGSSDRQFLPSDLYC